MEVPFLEGSLTFIQTGNGKREMAGVKGRPAALSMNLLRKGGEYVPLVVLFFQADVVMLPCRSVIITARCRAQPVPTPTKE